MKILIPGGHLTPALAYIDYIQHVGAEHQIIFVGREYTSSDKSQKSQEKEEITKRNIEFISFDSPKLSNFNLFNSIYKVFSFSIAISKMVLLLIKTKPNIIVSFGGYLAVPVAIAAKVLGIPIITHEQTTVAGFANRLIGRLATKVILAHKSAKQAFAKDKITIIPNFSRLSLWQGQPTPKWFKTTSKKPILYITGGNQGSMLINSLMSDIVPKLISNWIIIHQTGNPNSKGNSHTKIKQLTKKLSTKYKTKYIHFPWVSDKELGWIYQNASAVITRAGANTLNELDQTGIYSIIIPLKIAFQNEQTNNAQLFLKDNPGLLIDQDKVKAATIISTLNKLKTKKISKKSLAKIQLQNLNRLQKFQSIIRKVIKKK